MTGAGGGSPYPGNLIERVVGAEHDVQDHERRLLKLEQTSTAVLAERVANLEKRIDRLVFAAYSVAGLIVAALGLLLGRGL